MTVPLNQQKNVVDVADRLRSQIGAASSAQGLLADTALQPRTTVFVLASCVADGVTDDRVALQSDLDYLASRGGGYLLLPPGTILLSAVDGRCLKYYSNTSIVGSSKTMTILKRKAGAMGHVLDADIGVNGASFAHFQIDGNKTAETQGAVAGYHGIRGAGTSNFTAEHLIVRDCIYYGIGLQGIENLENDVRITDVETYGNGGWSTSGATFGDGVDIKSANRVWLTRCHSHNNAQKGLDVRCSNLDVTDCIGIGNGEDGLNVRGRGDLATNVPMKASVKGGCFDGNGINGISVFQDSELGTGIASIIGVRANGNPQRGIFINDADLNVTLIGNICNGNTLAGIRCIAAIATVTGNEMVGNGGYGYDNAAINNRHVVTGNVALNNPTANIRAVGGALALHANNITA